MNFLIADSFTNALAKLQQQEQKAAKITVFDLQQDPASPGLKFHRIDASKDPNFWSIRVNRDIRIVVHKTAASFLVAYVDHHDDAYAWAERRRIEAHPKTGAAQIVEVRERVEEIALPAQISDAPENEQHPLFWATSDDDLLGVGVPEDWVEDVKAATEDRFLQLIDHLPSEASEALLKYTETGQFAAVDPVAPSTDAFDHPDAQRRFRVLDNKDELERALDYPWDKWTVFLHPTQRRTVEQTFKGPARVSGSAGTGKTVVALHRAANIVKRDPSAKLLLTTFSEPLANNLQHKLRMLLSEAQRDRVTVRSFIGAARDLGTLAAVFDARLAKESDVLSIIGSTLTTLDGSEFSERFITSEWFHVVDPWQVGTLDEYSTVPRLGRKSRLGTKQRERLWPVFEKIRTDLHSRGFITPSELFLHVSNHYSGNAEKPFSHIVVDEAQDLGVPELRMLSAIAPTNEDTLFFAGDLGQRIFQEPFSWKSLGIDIRGRSQTLKVNYRTSHQIRRAADGLLPAAIRDVDGVTEERTGTVSVFNGPSPKHQVFSDIAAEVSGVADWILRQLDDGVLAEEIGIFVRTKDELGRARDTVKRAKSNALELSERIEDREGRIAIGTMHLAKGLEFKAVAVMACDDELLPLQSRIESAADEASLDDFYETERSLFYVACTRARDALFVSGVEPASIFFDDLDLR